MAESVASAHSQMNGGPPTATLPQRPQLSDRAISDLARAGFDLARQPAAEISFLVQHEEDKPGLLLDTIGRGESATPTQGHSPTSPGPATRAATVDGAATVDEDFSETVTAAIHGRSYIAVTAVTSTPAGAMQKEGTFRGRLPPNPTFLYDRAQILEGLILLGNTATRPSMRESQRVSKLIQKVSALAKVQHAPILSLTFPAQVAPQADPSLPQRDWPAAVGPALRFSLALQRSTAAVRVRIVDEVSDWCREFGAGLAIGDPGLGARSGNWVSVLPVHTSRHGGPPPRGLLPATFVGPARVGSTNAIIEYTRLWDGIGVSGCAVVSLNDLAFVHLQLATNSAAVNAKALDAECKAQTEIGRRRSLSDRLNSVCTHLAGGATRQIEKTESTLVERAGDYSGFFGPYVPVDTAEWGRQGDAEAGIWVSWLARRGPGVLRGPLLDLERALHDLGGVHGTIDYNIEYLVCREVSDGRLRAVGKLSLPERTRLTLEAGVVAESEERLPAKVCRRLEDLWRTRLAKRDIGIIELTVSWQEFWLGHWSAPA